jgi:hypothetical protein
MLIRVRRARGHDGSLQDGLAKCRKETDQFTAALVLGETDDYSDNITAHPVHVHDLQASTLHLMGVDHTRLTYRFAGRYFRLTDVHGNVAKKLLA